MEISNTTHLGDDRDEDEIIKLKIKRRRKIVKGEEVLHKIPRR